MGSFILKNLAKITSGVVAAFFAVYSISATLALVYLSDLCSKTGVF